jgi:hypothetical protein
MQTKLHREVDDLEARVARIKRVLTDKEHALARSCRAMLFHYYRRKLRDFITRTRIAGGEL